MEARWPGKTNVHVSNSPLAQAASYHADEIEDRILRAQMSPRHSVTGAIDDPDSDILIDWVKNNPR